jgi:hypothetical protein
MRKPFEHVLSFIPFVALSWYAAAQEPVLSPLGPLSAKTGLLKSNRTAQWSG